jgi:maleylacetate reductase
LAVASPYWNPRPIERAAIRALLQDAYDGRPPPGTSSHQD